MNPRCVALLLVAAVSGCSSKGRDGQPRDAGPRPKLRPSGTAISLPAAVPRDEHRIELLQAGGEPRRSLRYAPAVGATQTLVVTSDIDLSLGAGEHQMFAQKTVETTAVTLRVERIAANGEVYLSLSARELPRADRPRGAAPAELPKPFTGSAVISARGIARSVDIPALEGQEDKRDTLSIADYFVGLPAEPVGIGAKWRVHSDVVRNGMSMTLIETYTIMSMDHDRIAVSLLSAQRHRSQLVPSMQTDPRNVMEMNDIEAFASGKFELHPGKPVLSTGTMKLRVGAAMRSRQPARVLDMTFRMRANVGMELE